jgi:hypothetical protein
VNHNSCHFSYWSFISVFERIFPQHCETCCPFRVRFSVLYYFTLNIILLLVLKTLKSVICRNYRICIENPYFTNVSGVAWINTILIYLTIYWNCWEFFVRWRRMLLDCLRFFRYGFNPFSACNDKVIYLYWYRICVSSNHEQLSYHLDQNSYSSLWFVWWREFLCTAWVSVPNNALEIFVRRRASKECTIDSNGQHAHNMFERLDVFYRM